MGGRFRVGVAVGGVLAAGVLGAPASGQIPTPDPGIYAPDYGSVIAQNTFLRQSLGQPGGGTRARNRQREKPGRRERGERRPTARQRATLVFRPGLPVSTSVDRYFVENFAAPGVPAETVAADLARLRANARADMRRLKWSTRHLGDVAAYCLLVAYLSVNAQSSLPAKAAKAVRRALGDELARTRSVRRLRDPRQQELAELLVLRVGYYVGWANDRRAKGDLAGAEAMRDELRGFIRAVYGLDPARVRLTSGGFVER